MYAIFTMYHNLNIIEYNLKKFLKQEESGIVNFTHISLPISINIL